MTTERIENMAGGQGHVLIKRLLNEKQLNGKCGLYAEVTLEPKFQMGYTACEMLLELIEDPQEEMKSLLLDTELVIREST